MRISDLAQAAGTTVRAVRHYHRLGLMPEPPRTPNGYRDYELADLVRLLRIRWLAQSGVPLGSVATVLGGHVTDSDDHDAESDLTADLESLLEAADTQIRTLQVKREALAAILERHRAGDRLSPLPAPIVDAFDELIDGEDDPHTRTLFVRERDSWEMLALTGQASPEYLDALRTLLDDPEQRHAMVAVYRRFGALAGQDPTAAADEITAVIDGMTALLDDIPIMVEVLGSWAAEAATALESNTEVLAEFLPDPAQQAVAIGFVRRVAAQSGPPQDGVQA
ncbi:MerR family transcriptional regulator [Rhodococcus sp. BUPNP1]|uniref:MerR family transcriptional regulator n=1 Tax=Rhodococcus sp. BUPNP1 TaxID=1432786 RepID=UPI000B5A7DBE|nr:MerR family transcriptional regulator [Rhodococcus sp. BUPNP1]OWY80667.1 MerR family transcriptional regulator [Rhodococcus sp. BUPNP1]